jgi:hypothetical protein
VQDARRLAQQIGYDPDRWFDHTEEAMLLLAKKEYARKARFGYVNGREPVNYVRDIRQRFEAYVDLGRESATVYRVPRSLPKRNLLVETALEPGSLNRPLNLHLQPG